VKHWNKSKDLFQSSDLLTKNICISAYEICSCYASSGREIFACCWDSVMMFLHMTRRNS